MPPATEPRLRLFRYPARLSPMTSAMRRRSTDPVRDPDESDDSRPSKTQVKKAMLDLQDLGSELLELPLAALDALALDERLREAIEDLRRTTAHGARKRQMQYLGKLLRSEDPEPLRAALAAHRQGKVHDAQALHAVERWRDRLLADDSAVDAWRREYPHSDTPQFQALLHKARREDEDVRTAQGRGEPKPKGRYYRELFQSIRAALKTAEAQR